MKPALLLLFVTVSSALVLTDDGEKALQQPELLNAEIPPNIYLSEKLPWRDELLFYKLLKYKRNNTNLLQYNADESQSGADLKSTETKRLKGLKQGQKPHSSTRKWFFKKGKGMPTLCLLKICSFKTIKF